MSTPVVLVAGLHASARTAVVDRLLRDHPGSPAVHHDLREVPAGRVQRVVRDAATVSLLVVDLWDSVEPRSVAEALDCEEAHDILRLTCVLTTLHAEHMPVDITRGDRLSETGQPAAAGDQRYLAEVLTRQIEYATALTLHGGDEEDGELSRAVLAHLAPCTPVFAESLPGVTGARLCSRELAERVDPATALLPCDA
ncbi:hypothetical protein [Microbispora sp. CA-102843]|uniref:hypothetical protein n=1 Tax=Microbispora sp. CA-102843 TaxID=3239952 RepID=UPI003D8C0585